MNISKLKDRLKKIGADISERTLRDWAIKGLITGPEPAPRKTRKRVGRKPKLRKGTSEVERGEPGRYYEWPEQSYQEAAAVWSIRNLSPGLENKVKKKEAIIELRREADAFYFRFYLPNHLFSSWFWQQTPKKEFGVKINKALVIWISAFEKARQKVHLDAPVKVVFRWHSEKRPEFQGIDPASKLSIDLERLEGDGALNTVEIHVCYAEQPVDGHNAYWPRIVRIVTATESGVQASCEYEYCPHGELIADLVTEEDGSYLWAFRNLDDKREFKNGDILEWKPTPGDFGIGLF